MFQPLLRRQGLRNRTSALASFRRPCRGQTFYGMLGRWRALAQNLGAARIATGRFNGHILSGIGPLF
jgi:hypothetical protein